MNLTQLLTPPALLGGIAIVASTRTVVERAYGDLASLRGEFRDKGVSLCRWRSVLHSSIVFRKRADGGWRWAAISSIDLDQDEADRSQQFERTVQRAVELIYADPASPIWTDAPPPGFRPYLRWWR